MKKALSCLLLLLLVSCNALEKGLQHARETLSNNASKPQVAPDPATEYKTIAPPPIDKDPVVQFTPKDRILALLNQFNSSPDNAQLALTVEELTKNKGIFGPTRDVALVSALNGAIVNLQENDRNTVQLLVQLMPLLEGQNQTHLRGVLARGFDYSPQATVDMLTKFGEDKTCASVLVIPPEIGAEEKGDFLRDRSQALSAAKTVAGKPPLYYLYLDACLSLLAPLIPAPAAIDGPQPTDPPPAPQVP